VTVSRIPLCDLASQHAEVASEIRDGFDRVFQRSAFIGGTEVAEFETAFARFTGVPYCVAVGNGTDALELALRATDVGSGAEVVLPANTFVATAMAVVRSGARPVLVDADPDHFLIDVTQAEARLTPATRAIVPVHLYGQLAPMEDVLALARARDLVVVEDAAQVHGARRHGLHAGWFGAAASMSFYPGKNLGAAGDAGAVLTTSDRVAARLRAIRNHGGVRAYEHDAVGFNSRLDTLQAVVLSAKLARLARWNECRREAARRYDALLEELPEVGRPRTLAGNEHVFHLYVVRVPHRDRVLARLQDAGVGAKVHYPVPLHLVPALRWLGHRAGDFPVSERAAREMVSLPIFPHITLEQQERVVAVLRRALGRGEP
jgi:dTDP-4-amino-4,6-dideoxygalactose transaminase